MTIKEPEWLDQYFDLFSESVQKPVIDLGCGSGADSIHLLNNGYSVISCDFSAEILDKLGSFDARIIPKQFDFRTVFPFGDGDAHIILASLSLHYFSWETTLRIVSEIARVLDIDGCLICRLNSIDDVHYGAGQGVEIEKNFYKQDGICKRFFDLPSIESLFYGWKTLDRKGAVVRRFKKPKMVWEVVVRKNEV